MFFFLCCFPFHKGILSSHFAIKGLEENIRETIQVVFPVSPFVCLSFSASRIHIVFLAGGVQCEEGRQGVLGGLENLGQLNWAGNETIRNFRSDLLRELPEPYCDCPVPKQEEELSPSEQLFPFLQDGSRVGRDRVAGQEQQHFFGKVCASGEDLGGTEGQNFDHIA